MIVCITDHLKSSEVVVDGTYSTDEGLSPFSFPGGNPFQRSSSPRHNEAFNFHHNIAQEVDERLYGWLIPWLPMPVNTEDPNRIRKPEWIHTQNAWTLDTKPRR